MHIFGTDATELVHIGQAVMTTGGTVDHLVDTVFNYPTLSEAYKVAALDAVEQDARHPPDARLTPNLRWGTRVLLRDPTASGVTTRLRGHRRARRRR